jgi:vitamin B12 transporter
MIPRRCIVVSAFLLGSLGSASAHAQEPAASDSLPAYLLEGLLVEARRTPAERADLPQQVDVVSPTDLERTPGDDVAEALKRTASVDIIQFPGLLSGVSVRGFRPQYSGLNPRTLILIDGRPAGVTNLATLDLAAVERVEVLKGPASALYGSSAMGGAINVVTRRSAGPLRGRAEVSYGSFRSFRGEVSSGGNLTDRLDFDLGLAASGRAGGMQTGDGRVFGAAEVTKYFADGRTGTLPELTRDTVLAFSEYASRSGSLRAGYDLSPDWRLEARAERFFGDDVENPGDLNVTAYSTRTLNDLDRSTGDLALTGRSGRHSLLLRGYLAREVTSYYDDPAAPSFVSSRSPNRWHGAQLQDVLRLGSHTLTAGLDYAASDAASEVFSAADTPTSPWNADASIHSRAAFAEARVDILGDGSLVGTVGGRMDRITFEVEEALLSDGTRVQHATETHSVFNPSGGLVLQPGGGVRLHASGGRAFVTPGAFNVAGYSESPVGPATVIVTRGNPALDPETGVSWDAGAGIQRREHGWDVDLTYFDTRVQGRIAAVPVVFDDVRLTAGGDTIKAITTYANADEGRIRGVEAAASWDLGARTGYAYSLRFFASGTRMLSARETTGGVTTDIRNVADMTVVAGVDLDDLERFGVRLSGRYVGERLDADFTDFLNPGDVRYPRFLVLDLSGSLRFGDRYRLSAEVANLGDENYYEVRGYPLAGRTLRMGLGVTW